MRHPIPQLFFRCTLPALLWELAALLRTGNLTTGKLQRQQLNRNYLPAPRGTLYPAEYIGEVYFHNEHKKSFTK
jgi:hypothetical protein